MISLLISSRKNSKFLAKLMHSIKAKTSFPPDVQILVMIHADDEWNKDLLDNWNEQNDFDFYHEYENLGLGRWGLHEYFNMLAKKADGDWLMYLCDDHDIVLNGWDSYILNYVATKNLHPDDPHVLVPRFTNTGSVNHIFSRGFYEMMSEVGAYSHIDSYINDLLDASKDDLPTNAIHLLKDKEMLIDYTADPIVMTPEHNQIFIKEGAQSFAHKSDDYNKLIQIKSIQLKNELQK